MDCKHEDALIVEVGGQPGEVGLARFECPLCGGRTLADERASRDEARKLIPSAATRARAQAAFEDAQGPWESF